VGKGGIAGRIGGFFSRLASRPSRAIAAALAIGGLITLVFTPLPNGDSWMSRLLGGWTNFVGSGGKDFSLILAQDSAGNNAITIFGLQIVQNVGASIPLFAGAIITKLIGRKFGV